jgi:hypothetical protein
MPSVTHEAPIELIRQHPDLAVELLRAISDVDLPAEIAVSLGPTDLTEVVPIKFLADALVIVADKTTGQPALIIIIEPQGRDERTKQFSEDDQGARAFLTAVRESSGSVADRKRLSTIMLNLASDAARRRLETMMTTMEWKSDFIEGFVQQGLRKGLQEGMEQGAVMAKSEAVLKIIDSRAIDVTAEQRNQVSSCTDIAQLDEWFDSALAADTAADIFKS